jgi:alkylation response protein AidB-like acyl-CoA dehydrogenase
MDVDTHALVHRRWGELLAEVGAGGAERYAASTPLPKRFLAMAGAAGLQRFSFPPEVGGEGGDLSTWGLILEEVAYSCVDAAFPILLTMGTGVAGVLAATGRRELVDAYVRPILAGEAAATFAYSEDGDLFSMSTSARQVPGGYVLSGHKNYLTGGLVSDVILVYARDEAGRPAGFVVEPGDRGVRLDPADGIGFHSCGMASLTLDDARIPASRLVSDGRVDHAQRYLNGRRLILTCLVSGMTRALLDRCQARLRTTTRAGQPVLEFPNVAGAVGRMRIAVEASTAMLHRALAAAGQTHSSYDLTISAGKHFVTQQALYVLDQAFRVLGGHGYYGDPYYGVFLRDCIGLMCAAGTQDLLEITIGGLSAAEPRKTT